MLEFEQVIKVRGHLKITSTCAITGRIISVNEGENLVLNTGLTDLCNLLAGNIIVPLGVVSGDVLNSATSPLLHVPQYGQFGFRATAPIPTEVSPLGDPDTTGSNGTLDINVVTPSQASEIVRATTSYKALNSVTFQLTIPPNKGNASNGDDRIYREAVLMSLTSVTPQKYRWFARRAFSDTIKNSTTILSAEWTFSFAAKEN